MSTILRKAKVIASKLELKELKHWIDEELNGYSCSMSDLPPHRKGIGQPKFRNPYHGWQPIMTDNGWFGETLRTVFLAQPIAQLEELVEGAASDMLLMDYNPSIQDEIQKQMPVRMPCSLHFSRGQVSVVLDFVRNRTLDWTLELQERGISGEGFSFDSHEKLEARMVTNHIYGGNIGVLGNVEGDAAISGFVNSSGINLERLQGFIERAIPASNGLGHEVREEVQALLEDLKKEIQTDQRPSRVSTLLGSIRTVLEGAGGSIVASAILGAMTGGL